MWLGTKPQYVSLLLRVEVRVSAWRVKHARLVPMEI